MLFQKQHPVLWKRSVVIYGKAKKSSFSETQKSRFCAIIFYKPEDFSMLMVTKFYWSSVSCLSGWKTLKTVWSPCTKPNFNILHLLWIPKESAIQNFTFPLLVTRKPSPCPIIEQPKKIFAWVPCRVLL